MLYVENDEGQPIDGSRAAEICKISRSLFVQFAEAGVAPKTWTKASIATADFYRREMQNRSPLLLPSPSLFHPAT